MISDWICIHKRRGMHTYRRNAEMCKCAPYSVVLICNITCIWIADLGPCTDKKVLASPSRMSKSRLAMMVLLYRQVTQSIQYLTKHVNSEHRYLMILSFAERYASNSFVFLIHSSPIIVQCDVTVWYLCTQNWPGCFFGFSTCFFSLFYIRNFPQHFETGLESSNPWYFDEKWGFSFLC